MKGIRFSIRILVIAAATFLFINLLAIGSDTILDSIGVQIDTARNETANKSITKAMEAQCTAECTSCCSYASQNTPEKRTKHCRRVMRNTQFNLNDTTVNCDAYINCECSGQ